MVCNYCKSDALSKKDSICLNCGTSLINTRKWFSNSTHFTISMKKLYVIGFFMGIVPILLYVNKVRKGLKIDDKRLKLINLLSFITLVAHGVLASLITSEAIGMDKRTERYIYRFIVIVLVHAYSTIIKPHDEVHRSLGGKEDKSIKTFLLYVVFSLVIEIINISLATTVIGYI